MVKINGEEVCKEETAGVTVGAFLEAEGYNLSRIAVERNGEILPKRLYWETVIKDGDNFEVVTFVGGG